ncbi:MAG: metallophosphoesterase [Pseudomonadota bacterium]
MLVLPATNRWVRCAALLVACVALFFASKVPARAVDAQRIVTVGDVHGDYEAYIDILTQAGLIDNRLRWSGGDTIFVQIGDVPDRGPQTRKILDHLMRLERQAKRAGGQVIPLIGNHEAMNIIGDLRYVTPEEYEEFRTSRSKSTRDQFFSANKTSYSAARREEDATLTDGEIRRMFNDEFPLGYVEHRRAWHPEGEYGRWVVANDSVRIIGDTLFVHAGINAELLPTSVDALNEEVRRALMERSDEDIVSGSISPLWYRGNVKQTPESLAEVDKVLAAFGVSRIIVGHTPNRSGILSIHDGKVIIVDTGISAYYKGTRSYLVIEGQDLTAFDNGVERSISQGGE